MRPDFRRTENGPCGTRISHHGYEANEIHDATTARATHSPFPLAGRGHEGEVHRARPNIRADSQVRDRSAPPRLLPASGEGENAPCAGARDVRLMRLCR